MKKFIILLALVSFPAMAGNDKQVIATVDGQKITRGQIETALSEIAEMVDGGKPKLETFPKDFQREFVDKYIEQLLIVEAGRKKGIHKSPEIKAKVKSVEDFLTQKKYLQVLILSKTNDKALRELYNEELAKKKNEVEIQASHILVKTEKEAKDIKKKLDDGAKFEELAKKHSIEPGAKVSGGDLGYFTKEKMVPEFSAAAFKMKEDEISEPVKTDFGWHIIRIEDKRKKKKLSFKEAKPALETELARRILAEETEKLRATKKIEYKIDLGHKKEEKKSEAKKVEVKKEAKADSKEEKKEDKK